jgi:class 3 adenylate cyclase
MCAISGKRANVSGLQRVFYETSALLPALALAVKFEEGNVTEYLGDGVLALFRVDANDRSKFIYAAHRAAKLSINEIRDVVNEILSERYSLPNLDIGVGLALSQTLVTLVGLPTEKHPKAFGECVFRATKLSGGKNEIIADKNLKLAWPSQKGGTLCFKPRTVRGEDGYLLSKSAA